MQRALFTVKVTLPRIQLTILPVSSQNLREKKSKYGTDADYPNERRTVDQLTPIRSLLAYQMERRSGQPPELSGLRLQKCE